MSIRKFLPALAIASAALFTALPLTSHAELDVAISGGGERTVAKQISATIVDINYETRDITLEGPLGNHITLNAQDAIERFGEFEKGDYIVASYIESISGDLRAPTEAEMLVPWIELDAAGVAGSDLTPGAAAGQAIQALCTIEGMNRVTRTVTILDPNGSYHVIGDVDPARMEGVTLGQTIIITYTRAMALSLEKHVEAS
jgi:hypothetical protein